MGEENTKFFHAMATERFRKSYISSLELPDGHLVTDHDQMATVAWNCFRDRMGTSRDITLRFDLDALITPVDNLEELVTPFTNEEMDKVILKMPADKAPGPDGFNGMFLKKCWSFIKQDFYNLATDFFNQKVSLENLNTSFITLVPKKSSPVNISDFRSISLTNSGLKFITKLLADRLQEKILRCIHINQYGFIKGKSIHDCLAWSFEYLHQCKASKNKVVILKLDFEKAFDSIEHEAIFLMLQKLGFPKLFISWVKSILQSGTSAVLMNGVPGRNFKCRRGVRQGDPLSPLLFVLGAELLQFVINDLLQRGMIHLPISMPGTDFPVVQYADDTILVVQADSQQLSVLKQALQDFSVSTGLSINFHKSCMLPINISEEEVNVLAQEFGCLVGTFPFTYLGLPMGTTRPNMVDLMPLVDRIERKLTASSSFLAYGGRLQLISSCLSSMPVYFLCSLKLPAGIIKSIDRILRQCLWRKNENQPRTQSLAAWDLVCKPKSSGGLGIKDLSKQNDGLLIKNLHKFFNKQDLPWVQLCWSYYREGVPQVANLCGSFWWRDIMKLVHKYSEICTVQVHDGDSALFWSDVWFGQPLKLKYPRLFSFAMDANLSVRDVLNASDRSQLFHLPLSQQAYEEFGFLQADLAAVSLQPGVPDVWKTIWKDGVYTANRFYKHCFKDVVTTPIYAYIWKSKVILKLKVFAWLLVTDRLNTKDMLRRRHWNVTDDLFCVLCPTHMTENWQHLFFECNFSIRVWNYLQINWLPGNTFEQVFLSARKEFHKPFFAEVVILALWHIWKQRNDDIFRKIKPSFRSWKRGFVQDATMHWHRFGSKVAPQWSIWIDQLS